jgi:hypothetical protein
MADALFMSEVLKGITGGLMQGMQLRQQKEQTALENQQKQQQLDENKAYRQEQLGLDKSKFSADEIYRQKQLDLEYAKLNTKESKKQELKPAAIEKITDYENSIDAVNNLEEVVKANKDKFGRYQGTKSQLKAWLGYKDESFVQSQLEKVKQVVGKAIEGGVLRAEDTAKYNKIIGTLEKNPDSIIDAMKELKKDLVKYRGNFLNNLSRSNFDIENYKN